MKLALGNSLAMPRIGGAAFVGALDGYAAPNRARSVSRRLLSSYIGALIECRRSSDDEVLDIGVDANGDLDTASLLTFCGAGDGFITKVYDQVGTDHIIQETASAQMRIVASGVVETLGTNARPAAALSVTDTQYAYTAAYTAKTGTDHTVNGVVLNAAGTGRILSTAGSDGNDHTGSGWFAMGRSVGDMVSHNGAAIITAVPIGAARAFVSTRNATTFTSANSEGDTDSVADTPTALSLTRDLWFTYNAGTAHNAPIGAKIAEDVRWDSVPDLTGLLANQKEYYGLS